MLDGNFNKAEGCAPACLLYTSSRRRDAPAGQICISHRRAQQQKERRKEQAIARIARNAENDVVEIGGHRHTAHEPPVAVAQQPEQIQRARNAEPRPRAREQRGGEYAEQRGGQVPEVVKGALK